MTEKQLSVPVHKAWAKQREGGLRLLGSLVLKKEPKYLFSVLINVRHKIQNRTNCSVDATIKLFISHDISMLNLFLWKIKRRLVLPCHFTGLL